MIRRKNNKKYPNYAQLKIFYVILALHFLQMTDRMPNRPFIFISNDDGVQAKGIKELIDVLSPVADLLVVAPDSARSGQACAITTHFPINLQCLKQGRRLSIYACTGTPADCVKVAVSQLCNKRTPDLVVSGINHGDNSSVNAHYSGTMGAAYEGVLHDIPSVAFSLCDMNPDADFSPLRPYIIDIVFKTIVAGLPRYTCLNVNFPKEEKFKGTRICRMAATRWDDEIAPVKNPRGGKMYWLVGHRTNLEPEAEDTDAWALEHGYVAITPTTLDVTARELMGVLKDIF